MPERNGKPEDAAQYRQRETLGDGTAVTVRAIRGDDKQAVLDAFRSLDAQSVFTRFFHQKRDLSDAELEGATHVDFDEEVALVVTVEEAQQERIIAGARYVLFQSVPDASRRAELAFLVVERFQGRGLGKRLLQHLARIGRAKGVVRFEAEVLAQNRAMLRVFARSGLPMTTSREDGIVHVDLDLTT